MSIARNIDAERAVIGRWLMYPTLFSAESIGLATEAFTHPAMQAAFTEMEAMNQAGEQWTRSTLSERLAAKPARRKTILSDLADAEYNGDMGETITVINVNRLKQLWAVRIAQQAKAELVTDWQPGMDVGEILEKSRDTMGALENLLHEDVSSDSRVTLKAMLMQLQAGKRDYGVSTSIPRFDNATGGLMAGHTYIIGARPSAGKTAMAITWANAAAGSGAKVQFFTTETTKVAFMSRLTSHHDRRLDAFAIKKGTVTPEFFAEVAARVPQMDIYDDACSLASVRSHVMKMAKDHPKVPRVCIVDYIEEMQAPKAQNREQEISKLISGLKALGKEANCAMGVCSQLNRDAEGREPCKADLRQSGMLEQAADVIILLWPTGNPEDEPTQIGMKLDKNKIGGIVWRSNGDLEKAHSKVIEREGTPEFKSGGY